MNTLMRHHGLVYPDVRRTRKPQVESEKIGDEPEFQYQRRVLEYLKLRGWTLTYHTFDSTRSPSGFPDIVALRYDHGLALEIKSQHGDLKPKQREWIAAFNHIPGFLGAVVRPSDWSWLMRIAR